MPSRKHTTAPAQLDLSFVPAEEWRDIPGYEGYYQVSDLGRVRSLTRQVYSPHGASQLRWQKGRILRPSGQCKDGRHYLNVALCKDGIISKQEIHVLVLETFIGLRPTDLVANHIDGQRSNNVASNLEWVTYKRNIQHALEGGKLPIGEQSYLAKLTATQVQEIRRIAGTGLSSRQVGDQFGVTASNIQAIWLRKSWKHLA